MTTTLIRHLGSDPGRRNGSALYHTPTPRGGSAPSQLTSYAEMVQGDAAPGAFGDIYEVADGTPSEVAGARGYAATTSAPRDLAAQDEIIRGVIAEGAAAMEYIFAIDEAYVSLMNDWLAATIEAASTTSGEIMPPVDFASAPRYTDGSTTLAVTAAWLPRSIQDAHRLGHAQRAVLSAITGTGGTVPAYAFVQRTRFTMALNVRQPAEQGRKVIPAGALYQWAATGLQPTGWGIKAGEPISYQGAVSGLGLVRL